VYINWNNKNVQSASFAGLKYVGGFCTFADDLRD
jgi:hypothetical protein